MSFSPQLLLLSFTHKQQIKIESSGVELEQEGCRSTSTSRVVVADARGYFDIWMFGYWMFIPMLSFTTYTYMIYNTSKLNPPEWNWSRRRVVVGADARGYFLSCGQCSGTRHTRFEQKFLCWKNRSTPALPLFCQVFVSAQCNAKLGWAEHEDKERQKL